MKLKTTFILLAVVVVLFAIVYAFDIRKSDGNDKKNEKKLDILFKIPQDNINKIEIIYTTPQAKNLTLTKNDKGLWQSQPLSNDPKTINNTISAILGRSIFDKVKEAGSLADYGLAKPRITAIFHLQDGTSNKLIIGNEVPVGNYVYIKDESLPDIYMIPASIVEDFNRLNVR